MNDRLFSYNCKQMENKHNELLKCKYAYRSDYYVRCDFNILQFPCILYDKEICKKRECL